MTIGLFCRECGLMWDAEYEGEKIVNSECPNEGKHASIATNTVYEKLSEDDFWNDVLGSQHEFGLNWGTEELKTLPRPEKGFENHCFCNRGLRTTPNGRTYCPTHGHDSSVIHNDIKS